MRRILVFVVIALLVLGGCGPDENSVQGNPGNNGQGSGASSDPCDNLDKMDPGMKQNMEHACSLNKGNADAQKIASGKATPEEQEAFNKRNQMQGAQAGAAAAQAGSEVQRNQQRNVQQTEDEARRGAMEAWCNRNAPTACGNP